MKYTRFSLTAKNNRKRTKGRNVQVVLIMEAVETTDRIGKPIKIKIPTGKTKTIVHRKDYAR